ncbi:MAG: hypothetical protein PVH52_06485 [bacterium]|jgi:hypothetical protein
MDIQTLTTFFMWCTILNLAVMMFAYLVSSIGMNWAYQIQSRFFPISREAFNIAIYCFFGLYKLVFFFFFVIPYVVLLIMG